MDKVKFQKSLDESEKIFRLEISGMFILENSECIKDELVTLLDNLSEKVHIIVTDLEDIDLSSIQLFVGFLRQMDKRKIIYTIEWNIDPDQKYLLENVGLSSELFIDN
jgi:hypothetical protein